MFAGKYSYKTHTNLLSKYVYFERHTKSVLLIRGTYVSAVFRNFFKGGGKIKVSRNKGGQAQLDVKSSN